MLGLRRNNPTRMEQIASEIGECRDHLREVASLIAGGAAERLGPRVEHAKDLVNPKVDKARGAAIHGLENLTVALGGQPRKSSRRWPMLIGAVGVGVVAGAIGALVMQRNNSRWNEYEPVKVLDMDEPVAKAKNAAHETGEKMRETAVHTKDALREGATHVKDTVKETVRDTAHHIADSMNGAAGKPK